jgi:hypothetical protein
MLGNIVELLDWNSTIFRELKEERRRWVSLSPLGWGGGVQWSDKSSFGPDIFVGLAFSF